MAKIQKTETMNREALEHEALMLIMPLNYYELGDCMGETSDYQLKVIIALGGYF